MKGNAPVRQSGGPTAVINSSLAGAFKTVKERGYQKVYGTRFGVQGFLDEQRVDLSGYIRSKLGLKLPKRTPSAFLSTCRYKLSEVHEDKEVFDEALALLDKLDIGVFIYIDGNDSMDMIRKLSDYTLLTGMRQRFAGCPKTIDNDLAITDHTPGFGSATKYIAASTKEMIRDTLGFSYKKRNMNIIEIVGWNTGWLVDATALARQEDCGGPDLICLPEISLDIEAFVERVTGLLKKEDVIVAAVSEGIRTAGGTYVHELTDGAHSKDAFERIQMTGTASYLAGFVHGRLGIKARAVELSTLQRTAVHLVSHVDADEAFAVGGATAKATDEGSSGVMIMTDRVSDDPYQSAIGVYDMHRVANGERLVPRSWINTAGDYVTDEFVSYVKPLIQGRYSPVMVTGLPCYLVINQKSYSNYRI